MIEVTSLCANRGDAPVLFDVSLSVEKGQITALIGRNGMGKTTLLMSIMGLVPVRSGSVRFDGKRISSLEPYEIARRGIGYVPEGRGIFHTLTVEENLLLCNRVPSRRAAELRRIYELFPALALRRNSRGSVLSGGQQQQLAIGRGLMSSPKLLLIDEFSEGIQPNIVQSISDSLKTLAADGLAVLIVEQNARLALQISDRYYLLQKGKVVSAGESDHGDDLPDELKRFLII